MIFSTQYKPTQVRHVLFVSVLGFAFFVFLIAFVITPALERESQWQAQRLCKYHGVCNGTGV